MFYIWLAIAVVLALIEMSTVNLVSIWYIISSISAMLISLMTDNISVQVAVFVLGGTILLILTKDAIKKILTEKTIRKKSLVSQEKSQMKTINTLFVERIKDSFEFLE